MSHAWGTVRALPSREVLGSFEYNGTSDVARRVVASEEEIRSEWREDANDRECTCPDRIEQPVELFADYGSGCTWTSRVCLRCMTITGPRSEYDDADREIDLVAPLPPPALPSPRG